MWVIRRPVLCVGDLQHACLTVGAWFQGQRVVELRDDALTRSNRDLHLCRDCVVTGVLQLQLKGSRVVGDLWLDENVLHIDVARRNQTNRLPDSASDCTAPLRCFHRSHAVHSFVLHQDRPNDAKDQSITAVTVQQIVDSKLNGVNPPSCMPTTLSFSHTSDRKFTASN